MSETTVDAFLGGRLCLRQPRDGYRAGVDPVLLAASVPAHTGESVLELGTGSGVAALCLMARVQGLRMTGVERNAALARLAETNAAENGFDARMIQADLTDLPSDLRGMSFDHVIANPPFFDRARGSPAGEPTREGGRGQDTPLSNWIEIAVRRLKPGGRLSMILRVESLPCLLSHLDGRLGDVAVLPFAARAGRPAKLFLLQARKGAKGPFCLLAPFVLHAGEVHERDGDDYTPETTAILRDGAGLDLSSLMLR